MASDLGHVILGPEHKTERSGAQARFQPAREPQPRHAAEFRDQGNIHPRLEALTNAQTRAVSAAVSSRSVSRLICPVSKTASP